MAVVLAYDELPTGSDIRREPRAGGVKIVIPSGGVPDAVKRRMYRDSALNACLFVMGLLLIIIGIVIGMRMLGRMRLSPTELRLAIALFVVAVVALFALVWRVMAVARIDAIRIARRQATVLDVDERRLMIEQSGPAGALSATVPAQKIKRVRLREFDGETLLPVIEIVHTDGDPIVLGRGREQIELRWILNAIRAAMAKPAEP